MLLFVIPILLMSSGVNSQVDFLGQTRSAASDAQIKFAIENNYDQTGPGVKGPAYAYDTYKTLDDALIGYLDDPDTKLPKHERTMAEKKLLSMQKQTYLHDNRPIFLSAYSDKSIFNSVVQPHPNEHRNHFGFVKSAELEKVPYRLHKLQSVRGSPLNLAHFTKEPVLGLQDFNPNPQYTFSYGVHDKLTGDSKSAHETRSGGAVRGFYTLRDADGATRTVQYAADDALGFRAVVERTDANSQ